MATEWARFWVKVSVQTDGCWHWTASRYSNGYGAFYPSGKPRRSACAHRYAYERLVGPVPEGLDLDHLCRVRHCVNPAHLEPVTRSENLRRGANPAPRDACKRGHPLSGENLYLQSNGRRTCKACKLIAKRKSRSAIKKNPERLAEYRAADAQRAQEYRARKRGGPAGPPNGAKTHCPQGHPLSGENLYVIPGGGRKCRQCTRAANRRAHAKRMARTV